MTIVRTRQNGSAAGNNGDADLLRGFLHQPFAAARGRGRQVKLAAGQRILIVIAAAYADQLIDLVVIRSDILVANRPRDFPPIPLGTGEVYVRVPQRYTPPNVGLAAASPNTHEIERVLRVRNVGLLFGIEIELRADACPASTRSRHSHGFTCDQNFERSNLAPASSIRTLMPLRVKFHAAIPPEAPLPTIMTSCT